MGREKITRFLRKVDGEVVFNFSLALEKRKDMVECDSKGAIINVNAAKDEAGKKKKLTKKEAAAAAKAAKETAAKAAAAQEEADQEAAKLAESEAKAKADKKD